MTSPLTFVILLILNVGKAKVPSFTHSGEATRMFRTANVPGRARRVRWFITLQGDRQMDREAEERASRAPASGGESSSFCGSALPGPTIRSCWNLAQAGALAGLPCCSHPDCLLASSFAEPCLPSSLLMHPPPPSLSCCSLMLQSLHVAVPSAGDGHPAHTSGGS